MLTNDEAVKILELYSEALDNVQDADADESKKFDSFQSQNNLISYVLSLVSEEEAQPEDDEPLKVGDRVRVKASDEHKYSGKEGYIKAECQYPSFDWIVSLDEDPKSDLFFRSSELEKIR